MREAATQWWAGLLVTMALCGLVFVVALLLDMREDTKAKQGGRT